MGIKNFRGFTLIELLVVIAIIGILAAVGVVAYNGYTTAAKKAVVKQNFRTTVSYMQGEFANYVESIVQVEFLAIQVFHVMIYILVNNGAVQQYHFHINLNYLILLIQQNKHTSAQLTITH
jgi:prepilin-type N-terminal cleavage/methylation domain-containing protein